MSNQQLKYQKLLEAAHKLRTNKINTEKDKIEVMKDTISQPDYKRAIALLVIEMKSASLDFELIDKYASALSDLGVSLSEQINKSDYVGDEKSCSDGCTMCYRCTTVCNVCVTNCAASCVAGCTNCVTSYTHY